jgi:short-subunit dehydrogenase
MIVVVTGGTSGIGKKLAEMWTADGHTVFALGLSNGFDISDEKSVKEKADEIGKKHGQIDLLVNSAGYGLSGVSELIPLADIRKLFEVDFFGLVNMTNCALKYMNSGAKILNIGSVMGLMPVPYRSYYGAAKAAVGSYSNSLRMELKHTGIMVCVAMPGNVATNFTANRVKNTNTNEKYGSGALTAQERNDRRKRMSVDYAAKKLYRYINAKKPKAEIIIGRPYKIAYNISKLFPKGVYLHFADKIAGGGKNKKR